MAYIFLYTYYRYYKCRQIAGYQWCINLFALSDTKFCDLVTSGETDQMDKHHAADCQEEDAAATSDPFGGNKVYLGWTLSQSSAKMKGCLGC